MKCKQVQELILTDYLDDRLRGEQKNRIQRHLESCHACREFEFSARKELLQTFQKVAKFNPPEQLWENIKENIQAQKQEAAEERLNGFWERVKAGFHFPRPSFVFATLVVMIFAGVMLTRAFMNIEKIQGPESLGHVQYLLSLSETDDQSTTQGNGGYGTEIEEFFL